MAKKPSIIVGQIFVDKNGEEAVVKEYQSALKIVVEWKDGTMQTKSAQQLRSGNFSKRTRKVKHKNNDN